MLRIKIIEPAKHVPDFSQNNDPCIESPSPKRVLSRIGESSPVSVEAFDEICCEVLLPKA